tara:strand:- start:93 stop:764 length:672 start_codon:yes stop_codon:yes gene_type:complete
MKLKKLNIDYFTMLIIVLVVFLVLLGQWQLNRAAEKKQIIKSLSGTVESTSINTINKRQPGTYQKIILTNGYWLKEKFIKRNIVRDNELGSQVYGIYCQQDICLIINKGWLSKHYDSVLSKNVTLDSSITGILRPLPYVFIKEKMPIKYFSGYGMIVSLDKAFLSEMIGKKLIPFELLVNSNDQYFQQSIVMPTLSVARHYGYAVQFYLLALVVIIGYIYLKR